MRFSHLECLVCTNGRLGFVHQADNDHVFLECEECLTGYMDPANLAVTFRTEDLDASTSPATSAQITSAGWDGYLSVNQ